MKIVGVIPARWGSTRLPGKSLIPICGKPLIEWVVGRARMAKRLNTLVVATDDRRIMDAAGAIGVEAVMTRADHPSGTDRAAEAVGGTAAEIVLNIQGDEPFVDPALIDRLADAISEGTEWDMATAAAPLERDADLHNPSVVKVVFGKRGQALYFSRSVIPFVRDNAGDVDVSTHWRHLGIYAYRRPFLDRLVSSPPCLLERLEKLEQLRALYIGGKILVLETNDQGIGVDTPEDVKYCEELLRETHGKDSQDRTGNARR